jgi:hypothetical protein
LFSYIEEDEIDEHPDLTLDVEMVSTFHHSSLLIPNYSVDATHVYISPCFCHVDDDVAKLWKSIVKKFLMLCR